MTSRRKFMQIAGSFVAGVAMQLSVLKRIEIPDVSKPAAKVCTATAFNQFLIRERPAFDAAVMRQHRI